MEERSAPGVIDTVTETTFDDYGRLYEKRVRRPAIGGGDGWSKQQWLYDRAGRLEKETTVQNDSGLNNTKSTRYRDYDAFGRARTVIAADNTETRFVYFGVRKVDRKSDVARSLDAGGTAIQEESVLRSTYDARGRMVESSLGEFVGSGGNQTFQPLHRTVYGYDPLGGRTSARRFADAASQLRTWGRDGRGFVSSERHPELGSSTSASGSITYKYGALGQLIERDDGLHTLFTEYDGAGRKTKLRESSRTWGQWRYGTSVSAPDYNRGKLIEAIRHNYVGGVLVTDDWQVKETYTYRGALGQVDSRVTQLDIYHKDNTHTPGPRFVQNWTWDALGRLSTLGYPACTSAACTGADDSPAPGRTVAWSYQSGLPVGITSREAGASTPSQSAAYEYHSNLQLNRAAYSNGTSTLYYLGTNNMARPRRIRFYKGTSPQFDTGFYEYDGSGNVWAIGNDRYTYDVAGRLLSGTVAHGGAHRSEVNTYDGFDNLTQTVFDGNTANSTARFYADHKNRMLGGSAGQVDTVYDQAGRFLYWDFLPAHPGYDAEFLYDALGMQTSFKRWIYDTSTGQWRNENYVDIYGPGNLRLFSWYNQDGSMVYSLRDLSGQDPPHLHRHRPLPGADLYL